MRARHHLFTLLSLLVAAGAASAADWQALTAELIKQQKPGFGGLSGVAVDHGNGHVYVNLSDRGVFRSKDRGASWEPFGKEPLKGRTEWPGCLLLDPTGKTRRLLVARVYGAPLCLGDGGAWKELGKETTHVDYAAVDWTDPDAKFIMALKHESGGKLILSRDGGKSFQEVGQGYGPLWIFDGKTAVVAEFKTEDKPRHGLFRTTDGGKTFYEVSKLNSQSVPKWHDGALYWLMDGAILRSTNKGESFERISTLKDGRYGPIFGKSAKHMFVLTGAGVVETTDGGETWSRPVPPPKELKGVSSLTWIDYDPTGDALYIMKMSSELYKMARK